MKWIFMILTTSLFLCGTIDETQAGKRLLFNGFEGLSQADISDTGVASTGTSYAINADDTTVNDPLLLGSMVVLDAAERTLDRTIFIQPKNQFTGMLLVNEERVDDAFMPSNQGLITPPVTGANGSNQFVMIFDGGFANGMMTIIDDLITIPGEHTLRVWAKVFDEDADGDGNNAESVENGGDVNEDITNLHVQFGPLLFPVAEAIPDDLFAFQSEAIMVKDDPTLAEFAFVSLPASGDVNPADVPYSGDWVEIETTYNFTEEGPMAIIIYCDFPFPGLDGALDITAMAMDDFTIEGPSIPDTSVPDWQLY